MVKLSLADLLNVAANILFTVTQKAKDKDLKSNVEGVCQTVNELANSNKYPSLKESIEYESTLQRILEKQIDFNDIKGL